MSLSLRSQLLLVSFFTLFVYYPVLFAGYNPVDDWGMTNAIINTSDFSLRGLFFPGSSYYYRPLIMLSYLADNLLWDMAPSFMHLENVLVHLFNSLLVLLVCRCLLNAFDKEPGHVPFFSAIFFAWHPINTESVSWISGRTDVLATSFVLMSLWLVVKSVQKQNLLYTVAAVVVFFLGCLTKETAIFFFAGAIALVFVLNWQRRQSSFVRTSQSCLPAWILWSCGAAGYFGFRNVALFNWDSGVQHLVNKVSSSETATLGSIDYFDQLRIALKVMGFYLKKIVAPWPLNFAIIDVSDGYVLLGVIVVLLIIWMVGRVCLKGGVVSALFLGSIGLASSALFVALGEMAWTPIAERYLYMPASTFCIGLAVYYGLSPWRSKSRGPFPLAVATCLLLIFGGLTMQRSLVWSNPVSFLEDTIQKSPKFIPAYSDLAVLYYARGESEKASKLLSWAAEKVGDRSFVAVDVNRAQIEAREGRHDEARKILLKRLNNSGKSYRVVAESLISVNLDIIAIGKDESIIELLKNENVSLLEQLIVNNPEPFLHYRLGKAYLTLDNSKKAFEHFDYANRHAPEDAHYKEPARILSEKTWSQ